MKLLVIHKLLINRGWRLTDKTSRMCLLSPADQSRMERLIVLPAKSNVPMPVGTIEAIMRRTGRAKSTESWHGSLSDNSLLHLIIEKSPDILWGRLEVKGLLLIVQATDIVSLTAQVRDILAELMADLVDNPCQLVESLRFEAGYDLTDVWELLRQLRSSSIADMAGVDATLINKFISGSAFPSAEQTNQIQQSIRDLGHQLLQLAS